MNVNPCDINRIKNYVGPEYKIESIEPIETQNYRVRVYDVNDQRIFTIDNYTQELPVYFKE